MKSFRLYFHLTVFAFAGIFILFFLAFPTHAVSLSGVVGKVTPDAGTYLYSQPDTSSQKIKLLAKGTALTMTTTSSAWFKVRLSDGAVGWVASRKTVLTGLGSPSQPFFRGNTSRKMVALTFDAGADAGYTASILTTLKNNGIKASFGLTGDWVNNNQSLTKRVVADGHELINHTLKHNSYTGLSTGETLSPAQRLSHLEATEKIFKEVTGRTTKPLWRPPYGDYDAGVLRDVGADGFSKTIMWDIDSFGWNGYSTDQIYWRVVNNVQNGSIILFHVGSQSQDANALQRIINTLRTRGFSFGTVTQTITS